MERKILALIIFFIILVPTIIYRAYLRHQSMANRTYKGNKMKRFGDKISQ